MEADVEAETPKNETANYPRVQKFQQLQSLKVKRAWWLHSLFPSMFSKVKPIGNIAHRPNTDPTRRVRVSHTDNEARIRSQRHSTACAPVEAAIRPPSRAPVPIPVKPISPSRQNGINRAGAVSGPHIEIKKRGIR
jgi:hypothetical protein